jgi:hypothetical protein
LDADLTEKPAGGGAPESIEGLVTREIRQRIYKCRNVGAKGDAAQIYLGQEHENFLGATERVGKGLLPFATHEKDCRTCWVSRKKSLVQDASRIRRSRAGESM